MLDSLTALLKQTLLQPREAAQTVLSLHLPRPVLWTFMALIVVLSVLMVQLVKYLAPMEPQAAAAPMLGAPFLAVLVLWGAMVLMVFCTHFVGRMFGGTGHFDGALSLILWLQAFMLIAQTLQILLLVVSVDLFVMAGLLAGALSIWLFVNFVAELHGFASLGMVFLGLIGAVFGVAFGMALLSAMFTVFLGVEIPNV